MDLSPAQRVLAFLGIVIVLGGLGAYLLIPGVRAAFGHGAHPTASPRPSAQPSTHPPASPSAASTAMSPSPVTSPDIYRLLPFTQADFAKAANVAQTFGTAYGTFSYKESPGAYADSMRGLITSQLSATLQRAFATPGVASLRSQQQQVSTGSAAINSLRAFGPSSLIFVESVTEAISQKQGKTRATTHYAVTVSKTSAGWQVSDIELATAGNS